MKSHKYLVLAALAASTVLLCSRSSGLAEVSNQDRTGAPGSSSSCAGCHNSGPWTVSTSIEVLDMATGMPVTDYVPGMDYTLTYEVISTGTPSGYGFQGTAVLDSDATNAGSFSAPASNTQLEDVNGRHIVEHNSLSSSSTFSATWTAPASGSGSVSFYGVGVAANGNGGTSGDDGSPSAVITLQEGASEAVAGCTYESADNYNPDAVEDDGSCAFASADSFCGPGTTFNPTTGQCEAGDGTCPGDLTGDDQVGTPDVLAVLGAFGTLCE